MQDHYLWQGRQTHGWFGHGAKPVDDHAPAERIPPLPERIHDVGTTLLAGLPRTRRHHPAARLNPEEHAQLDRLLTAVVAAVPLGPEAAALRVLGRTLDRPGMAPFVAAGAVLKDAASYADLRAATDLVARSATDMGLDRFKPFLAEADRHLTATGGVAAVVRNVPRPQPLIVPVRAPLGMAPPATADEPPYQTPKLPPPHEIMVPNSSPGLALAALGAAVGGILLRGTGGADASMSGTAKRFHLDPSRSEDAIAALAYNWAKANGPGVLGTPASGPGLEDAAQRVMRVARADPALLAQAARDGATALGLLRMAAQGALTPGAAYVTHNDEERKLVSELTAQRRSAGDIQTALDQLRDVAGAPSARTQRKSPGIVEVSQPLPLASGSWLSGHIGDPNGVPVPGQVAEALKGRKFSTFDELRKAFWAMVAATPELAQDFDEPNLRFMRDGNAPYPPRSEQVIVARTGRASARSWELHHDPSIADGGKVYDLSSIRIVTPKQHDRQERGVR